MAASWFGEFVWANGERYEGWFLDDYMSGKGTMVYLDESRYVGNFEKNLRSGILRYSPHWEALLRVLS